MEYQDTPADPKDYLPQRPQPICTGCRRTPEEISEVLINARFDGMTPDDWVWEEEGTLNPENGHFLCDTCYIAAGMPVGPSGHRWVAP